MRIEVGVSRVFAFRRIDQKDIFADRQSRLLHPWQHDFFRRSRIGCAFKRHEMAFPQIGNDRIDRGFHITQIRFAIAIERCRHTQDEGVGLLDTRHVRCRFKPVGQSFLNPFIADVFKSAFAPVEGIDLVLVHIEADDFQSDVHVPQRQW